MGLDDLARDREAEAGILAEALLRSNLQGAFVAHLEAVELLLEAWESRAPKRLRDRGGS